MKKILRNAYGGHVLAMARLWVNKTVAFGSHELFLQPEKFKTRRIGKLKTIINYVYTAILHNIVSFINENVG